MMPVRKKKQQVIVRDIRAIKVGMMVRQKKWQSANWYRVIKINNNVSGTSIQLFVNESYKPWYAQATCPFWEVIVDELSQTKQESMYRRIVL